MRNKIQNRKNPACDSSQAGSLFDSLYVLLLKMCLDELQHHGGQQEHGDQVGHGHETVEGIADTPDQTQVHSGAYDGHQGVGDIEGQQDLASQQELCAAGAVEAPAQNGGEGEAAHGDGGEDGDPVAVDGGEAGDGQLRTGSLAVGDLHAAEEHHQSGHGADDDGVHEHLKDTEHTLLGGVIGICAGMGDGAGTETCFVREDATGNALLHADEEAAHDAASNGGGIEGTLENGGKHSGNLADIHNDKAQTQYDVQQGHEGHQTLGDLADALDTANEDHGDNHADHHADDQIAGAYGGCGQQAVVQQGGVDGGGDGVDLGGVAGAEDGADAEEGVQVSQPHPLFAQTVLDVVHGAAYIVALGVPLPEVDSQGHFGELGAHAEQSGDPHPEHGTGTADGDGAGHTGDVAGTHGGRQSGADCLEGGDGTVGGIILFQNAADGIFHGIAELADLDKPGPQSQIQAHADDADDGRQAPDEVVQHFVDGSNDFQHKDSSLGKYKCPWQVEI